MNGVFNFKVSTGLFLACLISLLVLGCETPGSVGEGIDEPDINVADTTILIPNTSVDSIDAYSGLSGSFSSGIFDDPLFGQVEATSLLKPSLLTFDDDLGPDIVMKLRLVFDSEQFYGDSTSSADFEVIEMNDIWRGKAWRYSDEPPLPNSSMSSNTVGSFSVENQDSIEVTLSQDWVDKYRNIYNNSETSLRDSLYLAELFGLAIVPQNNAKIVPFSSSNSEFVIEEDNDTTIVSLRDWATSLNRTNQANGEPEETNLAYSTLEKMTSFRMDLTAEEFGTTVNISNVELVIPVDVETMDQSLSSSSSTATRPSTNLSELYLLDPQILSESIGNSTPLATGEFSTADSAFHFNITELVNSTIIDGLDANQRFYITLNSDSGIIRSSLFFNETAAESKRPRLIITYIKSANL